jgi:hypothetical protein
MMGSTIAGNIAPPTLAAVRKTEPVFVYEPRPRRQMAKMVGWIAD